jgi:potassium/chloride transporter 9
MVSSWKHLTLRVFLCSTNNTDQLREEAADREAELKRMLQILRIKARIVVVPWENVLTLQVPTGEQTVVDSSPQWPVNSIKKRYIEGVNGMIREHSISTAVTFMYLPEPPLDSREYPDYYARLKNITEGVGPCLLVHGVSPVTSTTI